MVEVQMRESEIRTYPFEHMIVDDFFSTELFQRLIAELKQMDLSYDAVNGDFRCISRISKNGNEEFADGLSTNLLSEIFADKNDFLLAQLAKLSGKKVPLYDFTELRIQKAETAYASGAHTDSAKKLLSVVIYLYPEKEEGTQLYETKTGPIVAECEWQQNRAFIFARKENKTWHSWASKGDKGRFVLVYTLMTNNPEGALASEGFVSQFNAIRKNTMAMIAALFKRS